MPVFKALMGERVQLPVLALPGVKKRHAGQKQVSSEVGCTNVGREYYWPDGRAVSTKLHNVVMCGEAPSGVE